MQDRETARRQLATVVASFDDRADAESAIERLRDAGYRREQVGYAGPEGEEKTVLVEDHGNAAGPGALGGLVTGAAAGGAMAWLGLAAIPAIGPFLAGGALGAALIGAAAGGVTGGLLGGLLGLGIPRHRAEYHEEQVRGGRSLVTVQTDDVDATIRLLRDANPASIDVERPEGHAGRLAEMERRDEHAPREEHARRDEHTPRDEHTLRDEHALREEHAPREEHTLRDEHAPQGAEPAREEDPATRR